MSTENFLLPKWIKHDGDNKYVLTPMWQTLEGTGPEVMANMLDLDCAVAQYLDVYGETFGVCRLPLESDEDYRKRIKSKLTNLTVIETSIEDTLNAAFPTATFNVETTYDGPVYQLDGTWTLDGSVTLKVYDISECPLATFTVEVLSGTVPSWGQVGAVLETVRAAGYIPVVDTSALVRTLDGSWTLNGSVLLLDPTETPYVVVQSDEALKGSCDTPVELNKVPCLFLDQTWSLSGKARLC